MFMTRLLTKNMPKFSLRFVLTPQESNELLTGKLQLFRDGQEINAYTATSSIPGRQYRGSWELKGGLIPPSQPYRVATAPLWMPNIRGVEGSFYAITPFEIQTPGATRGDFGVHFDANVPGSMGCVVLETQKGWDAFRRDCKMLASQGVAFLPMVVDYPN
jgi:hypothetical protein